MSDQTETENRLRDLLDRANSDIEFRQRFIAEPTQVLAEYDCEFPPEVEIRVVESTDKVFYFNLMPLS